MLKEPGVQPTKAREATAESTRLDAKASPYADLAFLYDYWDRKRGARFAPSRADIDPADLKEVLPRVMLVDVLRDPLDFRFRLSGTGICNIHGVDLTGLSVKELQPPAFSRLLWIHYVEVLELREPTIYEILLQEEGKTRRYARILLPLSGDGETINMLMPVDSHGLHGRDLKAFFDSVYGRTGHR